jgi:hypothetical protein
MAHTPRDPDRDPQRDRARQAVSAGERERGNQGDPSRSRAQLVSEIRRVRIGGPYLDPARRGDDERVVVGGAAPALAERVYARVDGEPDESDGSDQPEDRQPRARSSEPPRPNVEELPREHSGERQVCHRREPR